MHYGDTRNCQTCFTTLHFMLTASLVKFKLPFSLACDPPGELDRWPHGSVVINET